MNTATVMWWDNVKDTPPKSPNCTLPSRTPTTTPTTACKRSVIPMLLSPRSDTSDSDYDDVSIFSEESLSEQILDDLSCILDCSDESDLDLDETPGSQKRSSRSISAKSYDSSSICSGPFTLLKKSSVTEGSEDLDPTDILDPEDLLDLEDICATPTTERKHLSRVKILSSRPSPYSKKGNTSLCPSSPSSNASSCESSHDSPSDSYSSSPKSSSGSRTEPTRNSPLAIAVQRSESPKAVEEKEAPLDGIAPVPRQGLFGNRKVHVSPCLPSSVPLV